MKSRASIKGHPLHPILVAFPIAFFTGTVVADGLTLFGNDQKHLAAVLGPAGVICALLAAVPGIIDYFYTIPPHSSAKKRGTRHGLINILVVILFATAYALRHNGDVSFTLVFILEVLGFALLGVAGWLGGTLVYRNQIAVDPRYAGAGKWKEAYFDTTAGNIEVATADELQTDQMKLLHIGSNRIVLAKTGDGYVAFNDRCSHRGGSLAGGMMICGTVQCPWHGSQFDCKSGQVKAGPATETIATYPVSIVDGKVILHFKQ